MRLNISAWSIRQPIPPIVLFVVLMLLGFTSFAKLPVTRFPNIDIPIVSITVTQAGAAPAELETQVTKRVEDSIAAINGVKHIISTVTDSTSVTAIQFRLEINTDRALNDVKHAIARIRADPAAHHRRAGDRADRCRRAVDPVLWGVSARHDAGRALLACR